MNMNENERDLLALALHNIEEAGEIVRRVLNSVEPSAWAFPVGTEQYPPEKWYCAQYHTATHTGIDLNLDVSPWGDVDRGMPVGAVADGVIYAAGYSPSYLGSIILQVEHGGIPLYVRYWHLADDMIFRSWQSGQSVGAGECLGHIGNYTLGAGGDHCHLDMRNQPFEPHWWFTSHPGGWLDPVPILKAHLDPVLVDAMLRKGDK